MVLTSLIFMACGSSESLKSEVQAVESQKLSSISLSANSVIGIWKNRDANSSIRYVKVDQDSIRVILKCGTLANPSEREETISIQKLITSDSGYLVLNGDLFAGRRGECGVDLLKGDWIPFSVAGFQARFQWPTQRVRSTNVFVKISDLP